METAGGQTLTHSPDDDDRPLDRVLDFLQSYGEDYAALCMHAAIPLGLTPDLLHLIRYNFVRGAPQIAEADLLLSPLCHDVGAGFFQMRSSVRDLLIFELTSDEDFGRRRVAQVSELLLSFVQHQWRTSHDKEMRSFLLAQKWTALAYLDPAEAAQELARAISSELKGLADTDLIRIASITKSLSTPLQSEESLLHYAAGVERLAVGSVGAAARFFKALGDTSAPTDVQGVRLPAPDELLRTVKRKEIQDDSKTRTVDEQPRSTWPTAAEFRDALSRREQEILFPIFGNCKLVRTEIGLPFVQSGAFAAVFRVELENGSQIALRLFLTDRPELLNRYYRIQSAISDLPSLGPLVHVQVHGKGLQLGERTFSIISMPWVPGVRLDAYVATARRGSNARLDLGSLLDQWIGLIDFLRSARIAHGDLQPANIIVTSDGKLRLIDYDGMCVPALRSSNPLEFGMLPYQHPGRSDSTRLDFEIDNFAAILIYVSLRILIADPMLQRFADGVDNILLFRTDDLRFPESSALVAAILQLDSVSAKEDEPGQLRKPNIAKIQAKEAFLSLLKLWQGPLDAVPSLAEFRAREAATQSRQKAFLSYSHHDQEAVIPIKALLEIREHLVILEDSELPSSNDPSKEISRLIQDADVFVLCWSDAASKSRWVEAEWKFALTLTRPNFIRVVAPEATYPPLPEALAQFQVVQLPLPEPPPAEWPSKPPDVDATRDVDEVTNEDAAFMLETTPDEIQSLVARGVLSRSTRQSASVRLRDVERIRLGRSTGFPGWAYVSCPVDAMPFVRDRLTPLLNSLGVRRVYDTSWMQSRSFNLALNVLDHADIFIMVIGDQRDQSNWSKAEWRFVRSYGSSRDRICLYLGDAHPDALDGWLAKIPTILQADRSATLESQLSQAITPILNAQAQGGRIRELLALRVDCDVVTQPIVQAVRELADSFGVDVESDVDLGPDRTATLSLSDVRLRTALRIMLHANGLKYVVTSRGIKIVAVEPRSDETDGPIAILSDIRSNLEALDAVLEDIDRIGIRQIYSLGDVFGEGGNPCECCDLAMGFQLNLLGDFDQAILFDPDGFTPEDQAAVFWTRDALETSSSPPARKNRRWDFVGELRRSHTLGQILFVHGSSREPTNEGVKPEDIHDKRKMTAILGRIQHVCFMGQTRIPGVFTEDSRYLTPEVIPTPYLIGDAKSMINVGAVGRHKRGDPRACYVVFHKGTVAFRRVEYDMGRTIRRMWEHRALIPFTDNWYDAR